MKKLLIIVDYQNDFVTGSLGFSSAVQLEEPICRKIKKYRQEGQDIVFTCDTHTEEYLETQEGKNLPFPHCIKGEEGWNLYGKVKELARDSIIIEKPVFGALELIPFLQKGDYKLVELVGVVSNICVISNAILAKTALPEAVIVVDARCTASNDPSLHQKALDVMQGLQIQVINRK